MRGDHRPAHVKKTNETLPQIGADEQEKKENPDKSNALFDVLYNSIQSSNSPALSLTMLVFEAIISLMTT